jgi:glutathione S-transferase
MYELFVMQGCPYCRKVMSFMEENGIEHKVKDVSVSENHDELMKLGGKYQVPFLKDGGVTMYESDDIIEYVKKHKV